MDFAQPEPVVSVTDAVVRFGANEALAGASFTVEHGRVLAVVGANGAGKSTLFRAMAGLVPLDSGSISLFGQSPATLSRAVRERIVFVSEAHAEVPEATVRELSAFRRAMYRSFDAAVLDELTERARIAPTARFATLSRGQRALVAVGLALAQQPELLLLDDPTLGLDPLARRTIVQSVLEAVRKSATTVILATHDVTDVERVADDLLFLSRGRIARPAVELAQFVSDSSAVLVTEGHRVERAIESMDEVVFAWPRRGGVEIVLHGDDEARSRACEAIAIASGEDVHQREISLEEATLAWLARDATGQVCHG